MSDGGSEADRRKWTHKRAQFDNAIHSAQLLGFVHKLASGEMLHQDAIGVLRQVNVSNDQAQYVTETLAIKKELRDLARLDFHREISAFLSEGARLIPELSDGLASQIMMVLGHAGQNDAYLEIVSDAVSGLLADLDHPLSVDARKYLRLLWDQMEATRKLKQTEAALRGPSAIPVASPVPKVARDSGRFASNQALQPDRAAPLGNAQVARVESRQDARPPEVVDHWALIEHPTGEPSRSGLVASEPPLATARTIVEPAKPAAQPGAADVPRAPEPARSENQTAASVDPPSIPKAQIRSIVATPTAGEHTFEMTPSPVVIEPGAEASVPSAPPAAARDQSRQVIEREVTLIQFAVSAPTVHSDAPAASNRALRLAAQQSRDVLEAPLAKVPSVPPPDVLEKGWDEKASDDSRLNDDAELKIPTRSVPRWALLSAVAAVGVLVAAAVYFTRGETNNNEASATGPSAKLTAALPQHGAPPSASSLQGAPKLPAPSAAPLPAPEEPPAASNPEPKASALEPHTIQAQRPHSGRIAVDALHVPAVLQPKSEPPVHASSRPAAAASAEPEPKHTAPSLVTPPDVAKNLNPLDRIIAELRIISPDAAGIEDKARELSRIIANAKRKDAFYIIDHLGPPVALDPLGRDPVLEESLRTFAITTLGRVATDDDDTRAVSAIYMLGEWAKSGGKGRQKAIAALDSLTKENIVKASAPRAKALRAAKAQIGD